MAQTIDAQVSFVRKQSLFASFVRFMLFHFSIFEWWIFVFFLFSFSFLYECNDSIFAIENPLFGQYKTDLLHPKNGTIVVVHVFVI